MLAYFVFEVLMPVVARIAAILLGAIGAIVGFFMRPTALAWQRGYKAIENRYVGVLAWALEHRGLNDDLIGDVSNTVGDYVANHYGDD